MVSPAKRRKTDKDHKSSPVSSRNLDYFFNKQKKDIQSRAANGSSSHENATQGASDLTDEQLAKKLQAEWDQEASNSAAIPSSSTTDVQAPTQLQSDRTVQHLDDSARESDEEDIYGADDFPVRNTVEGGKPGDKAPADPRIQAKSKDTLSLQSTGSAEDTISSTIPFDESPLAFNPTNYVADLQKHWALEGNDASYALLTRCFILVNSTQSRIKIVDTLVNFLRTVTEGDPSSLLPAVRIQQEANYCMSP
jgi:DNA ligase 1